MSLGLMMLTGIIEFSKCLKSLSGATAALKKKKRRGKKKGGGGGNHSQKYSKGSITFEKLLRGSMRALVVSTRESKQTTVHCSNLRLPAASAHLHSPLRDPSPSQKHRNWGKQKEKETGVES